MENSGVGRAVGVVERLLKEGITGMYAGDGRKDEGGRSIASPVPLDPQPASAAEITSKVRRQLSGKRRAGMLMIHR